MKPKRVAIFLTVVEDDHEPIDDAVSAVVEDAESRGFYFEWAAVGDMDVNDVVTNSPLHNALIGRPPDR